MALVHEFHGNLFEEGTDTADALLVARYLAQELPVDMMPSTEEEGMAVANEFEENWNFPNCIGAMDGKHIMMKQPKNSGSYFFNYKGTFSIVLLALVDAKYKFLISDGGVFRGSSLSEALSKDLLGIPAPRQPTGSESALPFVIVADDAFPLQNNLMKPYPFRGLSSEQRIYNYRLSRARRVVENAFGILANRFRVFLSPLMISPENAEKVVLASCVLHNFLRERLHHATHRLEVLTLKLLMRERYAMEAGEQNKGTFNRFLFWVAIIISKTAK
eukprot:gene11147-20031_t